MSRQSRWSIPLDQFAAEATAEIERVVRVATFHLFRSVINLSPVLTGRFRANWNVSYAQPNYQTSQSTTSRGEAEAGKAMSFAIGDVAYICNGLPYAQPLEYGHSQKSPQGMVRISARQFEQFLADAIGRRNSSLPPEPPPPSPGKANQKHNTRARPRARSSRRKGRRK